jgi:oligopeptidase A
MSAANPLLSQAFLIPFQDIQPDHVAPGIRNAMAQTQEAIDAIIAFDGTRTFENTIIALDDALEPLGRAVTISYHLMSVNSSDNLRDAFNSVLPEFSAFFAQLPLNDELWQAVSSYAEGDSAKALTGIYKRHLDKTLDGFRRAGAALPETEKARAREISIELSKLQNKFSENLLDATNAFELVITDTADLAGLPERVVTQAYENAQQKELEGYRFTLQVPSYQPFMTHADNRNLRQHMYHAYTNRACDGELDNRPLIEQILTLRREFAGLLGYQDFADYRLETNMAKDGPSALTFVRDLTDKTRPYWLAEVDHLAGFAREQLGIDTLEPWDMFYATEKLRLHEYDFDAEMLRPYFPVDQVLRGLFEITHKLFGITVSQRDIAEVWHPEVLFYDIHDAHGTHLGSFYADWFPRESKRGGAWMNSLITGLATEDSSEPHLGLMVGNFTPPQAGKPALLSHSEVETTFHEFGHLLHHCLSKVDIRARAGTNVARDWVELPSQIMENWTWERDALDLFARHHETGEPIPEDLFDKLKRSRTFMQAHMQMRQLSFATVDLELHVNYDPSQHGDAINFGKRIMEPFYPRPAFSDNHFLASFGHVFTGGYAAGYYSYKWSEVLDADAFSRFKDAGIFNTEVGKDYLEHILSKGDSAPPEELYRAFMGRDPDPNALLARNLNAGLVSGD